MLSVKVETVAQSNHVSKMFHANEVSFLQLLSLEHERA